MDITSAYLTTVTLLVIFIFILSLLTSSKKHLKVKGGKSLKSIGYSDILYILYTLLSKPQATKNGRRKSPLIKLYKKYMSSTSKYTNQPFAFKLFGRPLFVAADYDTINQVTTSDACHGRAEDPILELFNGGEPKGMLMNNGNDGRILKSFVKKTFIELGLKNREYLTPMLTEQLSELLDLIEQNKSRTNNKVQVVGLFSLSIVNVVATALFGRKFSMDDPDFLYLQDFILEITNISILKMGIYQFFSNVWGVRQLCDYYYLCERRKKAFNIIQGYLDESKSLQDYKHDPETIIDFFLQQIDQQKDNPELNSVFSKEQLLVVVFELLAAAMDTTSKFLEGFLMFMCMHPQVQEKVQEEIDSVLGTSSAPSYYEIKSRMNYTIATFWEVHRLGLMGPFIPRISTKDVEIAGHRLKKGTNIATIYLQLHLDETFWKDPFNFNPENFLDSDGNFMQQKTKRMLIFGNGGRLCPGESIATAVLFTFGVGILQRYNVKRSDDSEILGTRDIPCPTNGPLPFHMSLFDR